MEVTPISDSKVAVGLYKDESSDEITFTVTAEVVDMVEILDAIHTLGILDLTELADGLESQIEEGLGDLSPESGVGE